jgi:hypothetical protein
MIVSLVLAVLKNLYPLNWLKAIGREAEQSPAIVSGGFVIWLTILVLGYLGYVHIAEASENFAKMESILAANTWELECSKRDRAIAAKAREIANLRLLISRTDEGSEQRSLEAQLNDLQRSLSQLETSYEYKCL